MKLKHLIIVSLILAILTIGAVSATDDTSSDDLAVSEDAGGDSIAQSPADDVNVLNDGDDLNDDDPDDEGPDEDYDEVTIFDNFDVNDENATVVSLYCQEESGTYTVEVFDDDDDGKLISSYSHEIKESDFDTVINVTAGDLKITEPTGYFLRVYHDESFIGDGWTSAIDYTQFRINHLDDSPGVPSTYPVLEVYCPPGSTGNVTVTVRKDGEIVFTSSYSVEFVDDNMLYLTLLDLNITSVGKFYITVTHDEDILCEDELMDVVPPIEIRDDSYIGARNYRGNLVTVFLPNEIENANITLSINGSKALTLTLDDFKHEETTDEPFWSHPHFGPEADETQKAYTILNKHIDYGFEEGEYEITVTLDIEGMELMELTDNVTLIERNVISNDNISIEIIKGDYEVGAEYDVIVEIFADESCTGEIVITVTGYDWNASFSLDELENDNDGWYRIVAEKFDELGEGDFEITVSYYQDDELILNITGNVNFYFDDDDDADDDADDGVVIYVPNGDDEEYNLDEDMDECFAFVSVSDELNGNITISIYLDEDEPVEILFFNRNLSDIINKDEDPENEGFTIYKIALSDLNGFDAFLEYGYFEIAFIEEGDDEPLDVRGYNIEIDEENEKIIRFWEADDDDDDEMHGEGIEIEATFKNGNILNNDAIVIISKDDLPENVNNEFDVIMPQEDDDPISITLKLDEILEGNNYVIRINDLNLPEFKESYDILMIVQFYTGEEATFYAEWMDDDEPIYIYESPCIFEETSLLNDDDVITIQEIPEGVDEFTITISKEGSQDIVKTFKFSELDIDEEDVWVAFTLEDLGIDEIGEYNVTIKFNDELTYQGNLNVTMNVDIRTYEMDDEDDLNIFDSIDNLVANFRISEAIKGYVKLYVDGNQVGGNIGLANLRYGTVPPEDGRQILLNDLLITESGEHKVKLELFNNNNELLGESEFNIKVEVGESSVKINEGSYPYGTEANDEIIDYKIGAPLIGKYFNIYFNGQKAGNITANGIEFNDLFTTQMFDVKLFKPGNYYVNVTFFDGENETDMANGTISINELTLKSDKNVYIIDKDSVIISFNVDSVADDDNLRAYYVYDWGPVGRDDSMIFNPYGGRQLKEEGFYKDGVISFDVAWIADERGVNHFRLDKGTTLIYVTYNSGNKSLGGFIEVNVIDNPKQVDPALTISIANITEGSDAVVLITTNATFTGNVTVQIGAKNYTVNVIKGTGNTTVAGLAAGNYNATAIFAATDVFKASVKTTAFTVTQKVVPPTPKPTIKLTLKKAKIKKSAKKAVIKATLKINGKKAKGKTLKFKFGKKTYSAKTNKNGVAKVTIKKKVLKKLKVGKKVKYQVSYGGKTVKKSVKVKK